TLTLNRENLQTLKEKLEEVLKQIPAFQHMQNQIRITLTTEGLRVDLIETERGLFFETGNPKPTEAGIALLKVLAGELVKLPNKIAIEGHTDSKPYGRPDYSNWELSVDRANAARRIMQQGGLAADQVSQVRGFADQRLRNKENPEDPSNRRISIIVHYLDKPQSADDSSRSSEEKSNSEPPALAVPVSKQEESTERK